MRTTGVASSQAYYAYGNTQGSTTVQSEYRFTAHMSDGTGYITFSNDPCTTCGETSLLLAPTRTSDGTGLIYMHARYYDPATGQFVSPDTLVPNPHNLFDYNRYMYGYGNPVKYSDPSGHTNCASGDHACWEAEWYAKDRWYRAHGFGWGTGHWTVPIAADFLDEQILDETVTEAGVSWNTMAGNTAVWTFARKVKVATGIVAFGQAVSGGLARLKQLVHDSIKMTIADTGCRGGSVPCALPWWGKEVRWPSAFIDGGSVSAIAPVAVHEMAHVIDWQSGFNNSHWFSRNTPLTPYGRNCNGWADPCVASWEQWADAVQLSVYNNSIPLDVGITGIEFQTQVDLIKGVLGGWIQAIP